MFVYLSPQRLLARPPSIRICHRLTVPEEENLSRALGNSKIQYLRFDLSYYDVEESVLTTLYWDSIQKFLEWVAFQELEEASKCNILVCSPLFIFQLHLQDSKQSKAEMEYYGSDEKDNSGGNLMKTSWCALVDCSRKYSLIDL